MTYLPLYLIVPLIGALLIPLAGKFKNVLSGAVAVASTLILLAASFIGISHMASTGPIYYGIGSHYSVFGISLAYDGLSALFLLMISAVALAVSVFSLAYMNRYTSRNMFYTLLLFMVAGLNGVVLTGDLFNLYVVLEISALSSYALVAFGTGDEELEASFKYMVMGTLGSSFMLMAIVILYCVSGTLNMSELARYISENGMSPALSICLSFLLMGCGIKSALVPFHAWLPDAHTSAPAPISAMLSGVLIKSAGVYVMIRLIFNIFGMTPAISWMLMILGTLSMAVGAFSAIGQNDQKRLLAYSSISQIGYIIFAFGLGTPLGMIGGLFHLLNHAVFKPLLFLNAGAVEYSTGTRDMRMLGGLKKVMPATFIASLAGSMSISGVPPLSGFWSKLIIILAGISSGHYILTFIAILISIITLAYFLKMEKQVYFGELKGELKNTVEAPLSMVLPMLAFALICVVVGLIFPLIIGTYLAPAADVLLKGVQMTRMVTGG